MPTSNSANEPLEQQPASAGRLTGKCRSGKRLCTRVAFSIFVCCASASSVHADENTDPTFSGIVARAMCYTRNITICKGASCVQPLTSCMGDLCGSMDLLLKSREYAFSSSGKQPLQITGVSPAELNKPLWVEFQVRLNSQDGTGRLTLQPNQMGGYKASAVAYLPTPAGSNGNNMIIGMDCTPSSDGP